MVKKILIADDEKNMIWALKKALENEEYKLITVSNGEEAVFKVKTLSPDLVLMDLKMPIKDGMTALKEIKALDPSVPVIMLTAHGTMESAIDAMKIGALDYISKPFDVEELKLQIQKALDIRGMKNQIDLLTEELKNRTGKVIVGNSTKMKAVLDLVDKVAKSNATVLITGESGTGKELVANAIHFNSDRKDKPYIKVNCGAIPENLVESELFGHERGAFTGAVGSKPGKFERADGGTVFLDEVGELIPSVQVKLLRVLQEREIERVGGTETVKVDVRVLAATNKDLRKMVDDGLFREDLYYRLDVIPIEIPALRDRREDIPELIDYFISKFCREMARVKLDVSRESLELLNSYDWRGNIRELENVVERIVILSRGNSVNPEDLPKEIRYQDSSSKLFELPEDGIDLEEVEKSLIIQSLKMSGYNQTKAAHLLGITRHTLIYRMDKYNIKDSD